jgi:hypothetical protein
VGEQRLVDILAAAARRTARAQHRLAAEQQAVAAALHRLVVPRGGRLVGRPGVLDHDHGRLGWQAATEADDAAESINRCAGHDLRQRNRLRQTALGEVADERAARAGSRHLEQSVDAAAPRERVALAHRPTVVIAHRGAPDADRLDRQAGDLAVAVAQQRDQAARELVEAREGRHDSPEVAGAIADRLGR